MSLGKAEILGATCQLLWQVVPCRTNGPVRWFRLCMRKGSLEKANFWDGKVMPPSS